MIRHGHKIVSAGDVHSVYAVGKDNPESITEMVQASRDRELSLRMKAHENDGGTVSWELISEHKSLAQAIKAARLRLMFMELSEEERLELIRVVYPLCSEQPDYTGGE